MPHVANSKFVLHSTSRELDTDVFTQEKKKKSDMIKVDENEPIGELEAKFPYRDVQIRRGEDVKQFYDLEGEIGRGKFGTVYRCREKETKLALAAKFISISRRQDRKNVEREVEIMKTLQHPRLIQLYDAFETDNTMVVILELIEGGELFERVIDDDFILTEKSCTVFMRQICEGVAFIHQHNIIHLDLKPENILCLTKTGNRIKIIDFGLARKYEPDKKLQVLFGTPEFVAPEVVNFDQISCATDMWSVGVICYVLLSGLSPFMGDNDVETMSNVTLGKYDFDDEAFNDISKDAKDFISKLLVQKKENRLTALESLEHSWLKRKVPPVPPSSLSTTKENMKTFLDSYTPVTSQADFKRIICHNKPALNAVEILAQSEKQFVDVERKANPLEVELGNGVRRDNLGLEVVRKDFPNIPVTGTGSVPQEIVKIDNTKEVASREVTAEEPKPVVPPVYVPEITQTQSSDVLIIPLNTVPPPFMLPVPPVPPLYNSKLTIQDIQPPVSIATKNTEIPIQTLPVLPNTVKDAQAIPNKVFPILPNATNIIETPIQTLPALPNALKDTDVSNRALLALQSVTGTPNQGLPVLPNFIKRTEIPSVVKGMEVSKPTPPFLPTVATSAELPSRLLPVHSSIVKGIGAASNVTQSLPIDPPIYGKIQPPPPVYQVPRVQPQQCFTLTPPVGNKTVTQPSQPADPGLVVPDTPIIQPEAKEVPLPPPTRSSPLLSRFDELPKISPDILSIFTKESSRERSEDVADKLQGKQIPATSETKPTNAPLQVTPKIGVSQSPSFPKIGGIPFGIKDMSETGVRLGPKPFTGISFEKTVTEEIEIRNDMKHESYTRTEILKSHEPEVVPFKQHLKSTPPWFSELHSSQGASSVQSCSSFLQSFDRRSSDLGEMPSEPFWAKEIESSNLRSRIFFGKGSDEEMNKTFNSVFPQRRAPPQPPRRPKNKVSFMNRDVPIGSPPLPNFREYILGSNFLQSANTQSAPQSPRLSPDKKHEWATSSSTRVNDSKFTFSSSTQQSESKFDSPPPFTPTSKPSNS